MATATNDPGVDYGPDENGRQTKLMKLWIEIGQLPPLNDDDDLGTCCGCGKEGMRFRNLGVVNGYAPVPGTGWGDPYHTDMRLDGALVVWCDDCFAKEKHDGFEIIYGNPKDKKRVPSETLKDRGLVFEERPQEDHNVIWDIPRGEEEIANATE